MEAALRKLQDKIQQNFQLKKVGGGSKFFGSSRRGEGVELAMDLNSSDKDRQKHAVKRIIANMTLGRDVSQLFVEVVKLGQTLNVELKKLVYLYVLNTAKLQPEKALMAVNTFLQDAVHASPIIRALAVRTMMCIRVECVMEYTLEPLRKAVADVDPYVRKTAAIGIGKLFHQSPKAFAENNLSLELIRLLADPFPVVASNACAVLAEVNAFSSSPIEIKSEWVNQLLNALPECSEWGQGYIMELLSSYHPPTAEAADTLLARVVPRLAHTNSSVVMGTIKVIAAHAHRCSVDVQALYTPRINAALLTLAKSDPETQFVVCKNVQLLLVLFPTLLQNNVDYFYIRFSDPPFVKIEKLHLILKLTTAANADAVVKELAEYTNEVDISFVKEVVAAAATVAIKVDAVAPRCTQLLLELVAKRPELLPQVITASKNIVRKYPELLMLDALLRDHDAECVQEEEAKVSLVWMLGEFCDFVENGPTVLRQYIESLLTQEQSVQLALLTAVVKVFLRNPTAMEGTLNHVLDVLTEHSLDPDVRDRAYAYWRLLSKGVGVENMKKIVHGRKPPMDVDRTFSDAMTVSEMRLAINTSAAVFGKPFRTFVPPYGSTRGEAGDSDEDEEFEMDVETPQTPAPQQVPDIFQPQPVAVALPVKTVRVDPLDDIFAPTLASPPAATAALPPSGAAFPPPVAQKPADPFADIFSSAKLQPPPTSAAAATAPAQPSLPLLKSHTETGGVAYHASIADCSPVPKLSLAIVNRSAGPISDFVMQINKNSFGFIPSATLADVLTPHVLQPGQTATAQVPLRVADSHFAATTHEVSVAVKSTAGLHIFNVKPSAEALLHAPPPAMDRASFLQQWKGLDESCEAKVLLTESAPSLLQQPLGSLKSRLEKCHAVVVADRAAGDQISIYGGCRTHIGLTVLFEIVLKTNAPHQCYVCCRSPRVNDVISSIANFLDSLFPPRVAVTLPAAATKPFTADDLFS